MKRVELQTLGHLSDRDSGVEWDDLLDSGLERSIVEALLPGSRPTEVQIRAIQEAKMLTSRRNLLVSSTTNSGKTLLGYFGIFRGLGLGGRVLLLEPLRALAQEKHTELTKLSNAVEKELGGKISVEVTTGEYRLDHEQMQSPPPEGGQLVVATPERIESILRNPDFDDWIKSISVVVVDEAHLLGDSLRGASLEYVITSLKLLSKSPRFILLSATLGDPEALESWLSPCDTVLSHLRTPPLNRSLIVADKEDDLVTELGGIIQGILADPDNSAIVFVYQTAGADKLARDLAEILGSRAGPLGARSFHSRQNTATREKIGQAFMGGECRCVVSTTALAMGVNLPATHVILRDLSRQGDKVRADELIQMSGRAGRGDREGHALLVLKPNDPWTERELIEALESDKLPPIRSALIPVDNGSSSNARDTNIIPVMAEPVLSLLARESEKGLKEDEIERFIGSTLAGPAALGEMLKSLSWLANPSRVLAVLDDDYWKVTTLGKRAIQSSSPLEVAAGIGQLIRDFLEVDLEDKVLRDFSKLDLLILTELISTGITTRVLYSDKIAEQVDSWMDQSSEKSVLFNKWIRGAESFSKADELLGSLGISYPMTGKKTKKNPRRDAYLATCRAIILWQRGQGVSAADVMRRWGIKDLEDVEERWRDNDLFLLSAIGSLWEVRCFYYHLREVCDATDERVHRVKRALQRISTHTYQLLDLLSWCSPLGPLFVRMRRAFSSKKGSVPARATLRKLEEQGINSVAKLRTLNESDFKEMSVRSDLAKVIRSFLQRGS